MHFPIGKQCKEPCAVIGIKMSDDNGINFLDAKTFQVVEKWLARRNIHDDCGFGIPDY
jgi:hypothetical protein